MAIGAGQRHLRVGRIPGWHPAFAPTLRGIGDVCSHRPAFGTPDAPVPFADDHLQLFGLHLDPLAPACGRQACHRLTITTFPAARRFHKLVGRIQLNAQNNIMSSHIEINVIVRGTNLNLAKMFRAYFELMSFTVGRTPDRHARGIKSYLLSRCFGSNHVCRAEAALPRSARSPSRIHRCGQATSFPQPKRRRRRELVV